jgi:plasmid stabilization system protein ParE
MIFFHAEASRELQEVLDWYLERSPAAASKFASGVSKAVADIDADPERFGHLHGDFQYARVFGFPYIVVYQRRADRVTVLAIAHTGRREKYWIDRR